MGHPSRPHESIIPSNAVHDSITTPSSSVSQADAQDDTDAPAVMYNSQELAVELKAIGQRRQVLRF